MASEKDQQQQEDKTQSSVVNAPTDGFYLLSGYYHKNLHKIDSVSGTEKKDMNIESMEPVANRLIYAGSDAKKATDMHGSIFITDSVGLIHTIAVDEKTFEIKPKAAYTGTTVDTISLQEKSQIILPPPEIVCGYMSNKNWITDFSDKMHEVISASGANKDGGKFGAPLELERIPLSYLRKPNPPSEEVEKHNKKIKEAREAADKNQQCLDPSVYCEIKDNDADYRNWYNQMLDGNEPDSVYINAYVLRKVRAIFFIFTIDIIDADTEIKIYNSNNELFLKTDSAEAEFMGGGVSKYIKYIVPVLGNDKTLPEGRYTLTVEHPKNASNPKHWNNRIIHSETNEYTLAFNVTFPLKTLAGEFEMACADPITLEEALVQQYPQYYYYLLNEYLKEEKAETAKEDSNAAKAAKAIEPFFNYWQLSREVASLGTDILGLELEDIPIAKGESDSDGKSKDKRINKLELFSIVAKFMHDTFRKAEHPELAASIDTVFQIKDTIDTWGDLRKSANDLLQLMDEAKGIEDAADNTRKMGEAFSELFLRRKEAVQVGTQVNFVEKAKDAWFSKKAWLGDPTDLDLAEEHANRLASSFGISQKAWNFVGKSLDVVDVAVSGYEFYKKVDALFKAAKDVENAVDDFEDLTSQYLTFLGMDDPYLCEYDLEIRFRFSHPLENGELTVEDILDEDEVGERYDNASKLKEFAEILKKNKEIVIIQGHTDRVDTDEYNFALSDRRAKAVVNKLVSEYGIDEKRFRTVGFGESRVVVDTEGPEQRNRRVVAIVPQYEELAPACRKGINILEKNRYRTVTQELKYYEEIVNLIDVAVDLVLAVASVIPLTAIAANAIALAKSALESIKSVDSLMFGKAAQKYAADFFYGGKLRQDLLFESYANQTLLRKSIINKSKGETVTQTPSLPENTKSTIQLRLRSEAIGGLLRLITRASLAAGKDRAAFEKKLTEDYKIDAYIQNFILNDGWTMPLKPPIAFSMDEFWLYAINDMSMDPVEARKGFGLDKDGYFLENLVKDVATLGYVVSGLPWAKHMFEYGYDYIDTGFSGKGAIAKKSYVMSRHACVPDHVNTTFHDNYPIHHLVADNVFDMASGLNPDFGALNKDIYEFTGIYGLVEQKDKTSKWISIAELEEDYYKEQKAKNASTAIDPVSIKTVATVEEESINQEITAAKVAKNTVKSISIVGSLMDSLNNSVRFRSVKEYSPLMPIKIVIIFKNTKGSNDLSKVNRLCPVSLQINRVKTWRNLNGPLYKTVARRIARADIENLDFTEKQIQNILDNEMYGCIIEPFYQLGTVTYAGIKPTEKYSKDEEVIEDYKDGDLTNMRHFFKCKVGDNDDTVNNIPIHTYNYWKDINPKSKMHKKHEDSWLNVSSTKFENEIHTSLVNDKAHKAMFNYAFFSTNTTSGNKNNFPRFFDEYSTLADSDPKLDARVFVRVGGKGKYRSTIVDRYKERNYSEKTSLHKSVLTYDLSFNWKKTPVEFITTVCCENPGFDYYRYQAKQDFTQIQCSANLINTELSDATGPAISQKKEDNIVYLGEVNCFKIQGSLLGEFRKLNINNKPIYKLSDAEKEKLKELVDKSSRIRESLSEKARGTNTTVMCYHFTPYSAALANKNISPLAKEYLASPRLSLLDESLTINKSWHYSPIDCIYATYGVHDLINTVPPSHFDKPQSKFHLFAFYTAPTYNHPLTGEAINCIRPFDDVVGKYSFGAEYYSYRVDDIGTSGNSSGGKALNAICPEMKFPARNAIKHLKPSSKFLSSKVWKDKHKDWQKEIKDWIENNITDTEGAKKLFDNMKDEEAKLKAKRDKAISDIVKNLKARAYFPEGKIQEYVEALPYLLSNEEILNSPQRIMNIPDADLKQHVNEVIQTKKKYTAAYNKGVTLYNDGREKIIEEGTKFLSNFFKS